MFFEIPRFHSGGETIHADGFHEEWGGKGCRIRSTGEVISAPLAKAVDSTGAGDTFSGVFAVRLAERESLRDACVAANAAAAKCVSTRYVMPSIPRCH